jgi:hypothetical protein
MSNIGMLRSVLLQLLEEHRADQMIPTSGRFLFYELVQRGILGSKDPAPWRAGRTRVRYRLRQDQR